MNTDIILRLLIWAQGEERLGSMSLGLALRDAAREIETLQHKCAMLESDVEALMNKRGLRVAQLEKERNIYQQGVDLLKKRIYELEKERDDARKMYCDLVASDDEQEAKHIAGELDWDCYD